MVPMAESFDVLDSRLAELKLALAQVGEMRQGSLVER